MPNLQELIAVFEEARQYMERPDNNFDWSSWIDNEHAQQEIDGILANLRRGETPTNMSTLFAPTGPMQEVSLSSGWGNEFLDLANRYEAAL